MARILISGATSRVATQVARIYAARGDQLYLLGRDPNKLAAVVDELGEQVLGHASLDALALADARQRLHDAWRMADGFDVALIAHGWLGDQLQSERDAEHAMAVLELNANSVINQLVELGQLFAARGNGHIAVCSSVAADRGRPRNFTYGAAKACVNVYLEGLRSVLWPRVQVHVLALGPVDTPMTTEHAKNFSFSTPEATARGIVRAIDRGAARAYVPGWWRWVMWGVRNMPEPLFQRLKFLSDR